MVRQFWLDRPENCQNKGMSWKVVQNFQPKYPNGICQCSTSVIVHRHLGIKISSNSSRALSAIQTERTISNFFFFNHSHKALTNRFLRVETVVMVNGYLPLSLSFLLQLQRDTLTANSFFRKGGQGWTWKFSSLAAAIWDGDERRNIAVHCWAQRVVPFSLKQRAIKAHQSEHFWNCQIERPHFISLQEFSRSFSQMCSSCALFNSKRLSGDGHGAPEKRKQCSTANH